jgi:FKBP-type peptidyl-prolyl cis-trans isomerase 2
VVVVVVVCCSQGGLQEGLAVELANNKMAVVVEATPEYVKLDANNMMSGKTLTFALEVLSIDRPDN